MLIELQIYSINIMYDRKLQEKAGKGSAKEESLNLNIINAGAVKSGAN